eukprot:1229794-Prymnesium_polylepis.1
MLAFPVWRHLADGRQDRHRHWVFAGEDQRRSGRVNGKKGEAGRAYPWGSASLRPAMTTPAP